MQKYGVQGKLTAQPGHGEELLALLLQAAQGMEAVEGCDCYIVGADPKEPDSVWVWEVWQDEAAHQASLEMPVFQQLIAQARPILAGMENQPDLVVMGGKARPLG